MFLIYMYKAFYISYQVMLYVCNHAILRHTAADVRRCVVSRYIHRFQIALLFVKLDVFEVSLTHCICNLCKFNHLNYYFKAKVLCIVLLVLSFVSSRLTHSSTFLCMKPQLCFFSHFVHRSYHLNGSFFGG